MMGCSGCGLKFSGLALFDKHRSPRGDHGSCLDPALLTNREGEYVAFLRPDGVWGGPELTIEQKQALGALKSKKITADVTQMEDST